MTCLHCGNDSVYLDPDYPPICLYFRCVECGELHDPDYDTRWDTDTRV